MVRSSPRQLSWSFFVTLALLGFLLSPFLILFFHLGEVHFSEASEMFWALKNTLLQAVASAISAVVFGFIGALGLLKIPSRSSFRKGLEFVLLLFNFLPAIFALVFSLDFLEPFPIGLLGVIFIHTVINVGLVAVVLAWNIESDFSGQTALAFIEGATSWKLLIALRKPLSRLLLRIGFFIFVICLSSFTVPLVAGGGNGTTMEVLIYEKIRISGDFSTAMGLALLQGLIVITLSLCLPKSDRPLSPGRNSVYVLSSWLGFFLVLTIASIFMIYFFSEMILGWSHAATIPGLDDLIYQYIPFTMTLGLSVGLLTISLFLLQASLFASEKIHGWISGLISLSPALAAFSYLIFFGEQSTAGIYLCLSCLFYPAVYRLCGAAAFNQLQSQQEVALLMGADRWMIFKQITSPQIAKSAALMGGVTAIWAMGDFAISKVLLAKEVSLGMLAANLMSSYRIEAAFAICGLIFILGMIPFFLFQGLAYVYRQKSC